MIAHFCFSMELVSTIINDGKWILVLGTRVLVPTCFSQTLLPPVTRKFYPPISQIPGRYSHLLQQVVTPC